MRLRNAIVTAALSGLAAAFAQGIQVPLPDRTPHDTGGLDIVILQDEAPEALTLPEVDRTGAQYLEMFYSWSIPNDETVSVMVLPGDDGQLLYVDTNNDEDLTNDGDPLFFPFGANQIDFYLRGTPDSEQRTGRSLQRVPRALYGDAEAVAGVVDGDGNLTGAWARHWGRRNPGFEGKRKTYLFYEYVDVSRGTVTLDGVDYAIGIYDFNQNGRFDDITGTDDHPKHFDRLLIDLERDGKLTLDVTTEVFKLNDVFEAGSKRYRVSGIDPYGRRLSLVETEAAETAYYLKAIEDQRELEGGIQRGELEDAFWDLTLATTAGDSIALRDLKGQYVLLNFWGEWCAPCVAEIPALVETREAWPADTLHMIGVLKAEDQEKALAMVADRGMDWPQTVLTPALEAGFRVTRYPTNILILPDGRHYLHAGHVSAEFFRRHIVEAGTGS